MDKEKQLIHTESLRDVALFLEGMRAAKGNLLPLGTVVLEELWATIKYLNGDNGYKAKRDLPTNIKP
jgi:hypothetical protein